MAALAACVRSPERPLTLFGAVSLIDAMTTLGARFEAETGRAVTTAFAGSGELARQIQAGAPADVVVLADGLWMDRLAETGAIRTASRVDLLTNSLVVIAPADGPARPFAWSGRVAIGDPDSVPAGRYARDCLIASGDWEAVRPRLVLAGDVRAVRAFVARGDVDLGVVYRSDAVGFDAVRVVHVPAAQPEIVYPAALTRNARPEAARLLSFLRGPEATNVFARYGFGAGR